MVPSSTNSANSSLDNQIFQLSRLADQIHAVLLHADPSDFEQVLEDLASLSSSLSYLSTQVEKKIDERDSHLELANISRIVNSSLQLDDVLRIVMDTIVRLTGAERGFLMLKDSQGDLTIHIARNWEQESLDTSDTTLSRTVVNQVLADGQPILTTNAQQDPRFVDQESIISQNLRSILCVPLILKDSLIGVMYADNRLREGLFTETEKNLLAAFANQAAVAIENARLFESVQQTLAEVTGLKNLMDDVFASIISGVITTDLDQTITLTNKVAEEILGEPWKSLLGKKVDQVPLFKQVNIPQYLDRVHRFNQQIKGLQFDLQSSENGVRNFRFNFSPLKDANGTVFGAAIVMEEITETRRLEAQRRLFERMVSPVVINQLNPDELNLGGTRTNITTLFADIRGYTSLSERCEPETLVSVLNRYLGAATEALLKEEGTIDKFMGDAILAFFNAPIPQTQHPLKAVRAALEIRKAINRIKADFSSEFWLDFGIGIHTGEAVLGLVGTEKRLEYTAIGDSVNLAKRLQENAAPGQILISTQTYELVRTAIIVQPIAPLSVKGKKQLIHVYELTGLIANNSA